MEIMPRKNKKRPKFRNIFQQYLRKLSPLIFKCENHNAKMNSPSQLAGLSLNRNIP